MTTYAVLTAVPDHGKTDVSERHIAYYGHITSTTDAYKTGGLALSFAGIYPLNDPPVRVEIWSETVASQYEFVYLTGTTTANGLVAILASATGTVNAEVTGDSTIPSAFSGDTKVRYRAEFIKGR